MREVAVTSELAFIGTGFQFVGEAVHFRFELTQIVEHTQQRLPKRFALQGGGILRQIPQTQVTLALEMAVRGWFQPRKDAQQRGLALAVRAD